ncbi:mucin-5AC-like [Sycon ciliatum]|uniref:mucin-5AC-like n=1 Tax=Sycon ciliatum TaxID=27933 RepID=UPI0031F70331
MHSGLLIVVFTVGVFVVIPTHSGATVSAQCTLSQTPGNLTIDNHMKLESTPGAGPILQPRTIIPFPNISFYSSCIFVQIDITADVAQKSCDPMLVLLKEFPGGKYQIASERIPPSTHITGIATWTGVSVNDYISDNSSVTEAYILGITMKAYCPLSYKAASSRVSWVLPEGSSPRVLQTFAWGAALEPRVTMTIRASNACNQATCDNCQTLYQSCPALGATGTSQYQYYCGTASNYACPTTTAVHPTTRSTTSPLTKTSIVPQATTSATPSTASTRVSSSAVTNLRITSDTIAAATVSPSTTPRVAKAYAESSPLSNAFLSPNSTDASLGFSAPNTFDYKSASETSTEVLPSGASQHASSPSPGSSKRGSPSATEAVERIIIVPGTGKLYGLTLGFNIPLLLFTLSILLVLLYRMKRESPSTSGHSRQENGEAVSLHTPRTPPSTTARPQQYDQVATDTSQGPYYIEAVDSKIANVTPWSCSMTDDGTMPDFVHVQSSTAPANIEQAQDSLYADLETTEHASAEMQERHYMLLSTCTQTHPNHYQGLGPHSNDLQRWEIPGNTTPDGESLVICNTAH